MSTFRYKAVRPTGEPVEGQLEATNRQDAVSQLADMGFVPVRVDQAGESSLASILSTDLFGSRSERISPQDIMIATREVATLLDAGVELERALGIVVELSGRPAIQALFQNILEEVRGGAALSDALEKRAARFPPSYVSMIRAGEVGGALPVVFERLATYMESAHASRENLRSALIYPILLLVMAVLSVAVMVTVVLPQFEPLFASAGQELPLLTRIMLATSDAAEQYGLIALALTFAAIALFRQRLRNPAARLSWHRHLLATPLLGALLLKLDVARFARTLGTLMQNGVATLAAFAIVRETVSNTHLAQGLDEAAGRIQSGATISDALVAVPGFPDLAAHLIRVGEETGHLEEMLIRLALIYEDDAQRSIQRILALLLPGLTAFIGLFIAAIIASIFLAIVSVNQLAF